MLAVQCRDPERLGQVVKTLAGVAVIFALVGLGQRLFGLKTIYAAFDGNHRYFFGPYRSHSNAGTFILMMWPLCAACLFLKGQHPRTKRFGSWDACS